LGGAVDGTAVLSVRVLRFVHCFSPFVGIIRIRFLGSLS
jgi:hypothetical protein